MLLKERVYEKCSQCNQTTKVIQEKSYGCDCCKKPIDELLNSGNTKHNDYLQVTVFHDGNKADDFQFCSWVCVFKKLKKIKTNYFITLPYLAYDQKEKGQTVKDFWKCIKANPAKQSRVAGEFVKEGIMQKKKKRQTHRSRKGPKLYAGRDTKSRFADIVAYKRAHEKGVKEEDGSLAI